MDLYDTLVEARVAPAPSADVLDATRHQLEAACRSSARRRAPRRTRRWAVPLASATFLAGAGAAAWAVTWSDPTTSTTIECGTDTYIPVESGNPVADCHAALARQGAVVPPLAGWITPGGLVAVLPKGEAPPAGSTPLPPAFAVDRAILFVGDVLDDEAQPTATACTTRSAAQAFARSQLALAGLVGWTVQVPSSTSGACDGYGGYLDPTSSTAVLVAMPVSSSSSPDVRLDEQLRAQLVTASTASCATTSQAAALVRIDANDLGLSTSDYTVTTASTVGASAATCAQVTIDPGGSIQATIWQVPRGS